MLSKANPTQLYVKVSFIGSEMQTVESGKILVVLIITSITVLGENFLLIGSFRKRFQYAKIKRNRKVLKFFL